MTVFPAARLLTICLLSVLVLVGGVTPLQGPTMAVASSTPSFQILFDSKPHVYPYPLENEIDRNVTVTNSGGTSEQLQFSGTIYGPNGFVKDADTLGIAPLPQPSYLYLKTSESNKIYIVMDPSDLNSQIWYPGQNYTYTIQIKVYPVGSPSLAQSVNLTNVVRVYDGIVQNGKVITGVAPLSPNSSVSGKVVDAVTKQAVVGADVSVTGGSSGFNVQTDGSGNYKVTLVAYREVEKGSYLNYNVKVSAPGMQDSNKAVAPTPGQDIILNVNLARANQLASYSVFAKYYTGMDNYDGAGSADGKFFAVIPFHSGANESYIYQNAYLYYFSADGSQLWKFRLYAETPAVDVSADGSMTATSRRAGGLVTGTGGPNPPGIYLLDSKGNILWNYTISAQGIDATDVRAVKFSHSQKYLVAGDGTGGVILANLATRTVMWQKFLDGQIRDIAFNEDDSAVYLSSGDGYLYALMSVDGTQLWRSYVGAWGLSMTASKDYLLVSGKNGYFVTLVDKPTGKIDWSTMVAHANFHLIISLDQSYMISYTNAARGVTTVYAPNGTVLFTLDSSSGGAASGDGKYFIESGSNFLGGGLQTFVSLFSKTGVSLWTGMLDTVSNGYGAGEGYSWISTDETEIIATTGGYVYFLRGSITTTTTTTTSSTSSTTLSTSTTSTTASSSTTSSAASTSYSTTSTPSVSSSSTATTSTPPQTSSSSSTSATSTTTGGGGIPEFPSQFVELSVLTATVLVSYLLIWRRNAHGRHDSIDTR